MTLLKVILSCCLVGLLLLSCGQNQESNVDRGTREQILYVGNGDEPRELDPQLSTGKPEHNILNALFESLVSKNLENLSVQPGVAERWEISEDRRVYTFFIRKNAKWSNGDPLTAEDFVFSWMRSLLPALASEWAYFKYYIKNAEAFHKGEITDFSHVGVKALGRHVLQVTLNDPTPFFLQLIDHNSFFPVHRATIEKHAAIDDPITKWTLPGNFVGNGPFTLETWKINELIEVTRNTHYWDNDNVRLKGVVFYPITEYTSEERAFRSGQIHLTTTPQMAIEKINVYRENKPEVLRVVQSYSTYYYDLNSTKKPFDDPRVRRAFAMAIDREALVTSVTKGGEVPAYSLVPPQPGGYVPPKAFTYNVKEAQKLLAEAGYPNGEGFPVTELLYNTDENHKKVSLAVQQMLNANLNVQVELHNKEWKVYLNAKKNFEHQMARAGWIADYVDPTNFFKILQSDGGNNNTGWGSRRYDEILAMAKRAQDPATRDQLFDDANAILVAEMPVIPVYYYSDINLVSTDVKNWPNNVMRHNTFNRVYLARD